MASERILAVGKIEHGQVVILTKHDQIEQLLGTITDEDWARYEALAPCPAPPLGALQDFIDYTAELEELQDDMEDRAFWSRGGW